MSIAKFAKFNSSLIFLCLQYLKGLFFHYGFGLGDACDALGRFHNIHVRINGSAYSIPLTMIMIWLRTK